MIAFLLASLPTPRPGASPTIDPPTFLDRCRGFLSEARFAAVAEVLGATGTVRASAAAPPTDRSDPALRVWRDLTAQVDDAVTLERCERTRRDPRPFLRRPAGFRVDVRDAVAAAFALAHPGERERALDALRWRLADELAHTSPDGFAALLARAVQIRLASRQAAWDIEAGWTALEASVRQIEPPHG
jgi:hypothetical protein